MSKKYGNFSNLLFLRFDGSNSLTFFSFRSSNDAEFVRYVNIRIEAQGDPNQNFPFQMTITLKIRTSDPCGFEKWQFF